MYWKKMILTYFIRRDLAHVLIASILAIIALYYWGYLTSIGKFFLYALAIIIGLVFGVRSALFTKRKYVLKPREHFNNPLLERMCKEHLEDSLSKNAAIRTPTLVSWNVDNVIKDIVDYIIRDYVKWWYKDLVVDEERLYKILKIEIWTMLANFKERLKKMDDVKFFTHDIVVKIDLHLQKIKHATNTPSGDREPYELSSFLESPETEKAHLRQLSDFFLALVLPSKYAHCQSIRHLLREILTNLVLYPTVDMICDPDFINVKLLSYLLWQQEELAKHSRPYTYAKDFKDFVHVINKTTNIESLKCMRYYIVTEIMQATTIKNIKKDKGIDADKEFSPQTIAKGDLLKARNLKVYINQLKLAKSLCEKQIKSLGGSDYGGKSPSSVHGASLSGKDDKRTYLPGNKVLSFEVIMESKHCRKYFSEHLLKHEQKSLLGFWEMVQEMKTAEKNDKHQLGNEIIQVYVNNPSSVVKLPKNILKGMEAYMLADKGPEAFYQAQEDVYKLMEERFYPTFIVSSVYHKMLARAEKQGLNFGNSIPIDKKLEDLELVESLNEDMANIASPMGGPSEKFNIADVSLSNHPSLAVCLLNQIRDKWNDKKQALQTFQSSSSDSKMVHMLEKEIAELELELGELDCYIGRTNHWMNYLGQWKAKVVHLKVRENERPIDVTLLVEPKLLQSGASPVENECWKVSRTVADFHSLHQKLSMASSALKRIDLPNPNKPRFGLFQQDTFMSKVDTQLQAFLDTVLEDEHISKSEALYEFLIIMPDVLRNALPQAKKSWRFSFLQLFKSSQGSGQEDSSDEELLFLDEVDSKDDKKDSIAEPVYAMIGDLFELKGPFSIFRRTIISIVQVSFGKSINKQLRETVSWISSEPMLHYYLQLFCDSFWPNGKLAKPKPPRTEAQKEATRKLAKKELLNNIHDMLTIWVSQQNARLGMAKVFEALQDKRLNKQLFHDILEAFFYEFSPELRSD